jgi:hypothetical protein
LINKSAFKKFYVFFSSIFIFLFHLPFVFAKNKPASMEAKSASGALYAITGSLIDEETTPVVPVSVYDSLKLHTLGLSKQAYEYAIKGLQYLRSAGTLNTNILTIADFSQPSTKKRLYVIDVKNYKLLFNTYVAHGMQTGREMATDFSNVPESNKSSLGFYKTLGTYEGKHGYSLKLEGLEHGINHNAFERAIVIHSADYVSESFAKSQGYLGRSWGCPALPVSLNKPIIDRIKNGSCLFIYSNQKAYSIQSRIINHQSRVAA